MSVVNALEMIQGFVGMMCSEGQVVLTTTGRMTTPFPKVDSSTNKKVTRTVKCVDEWLVENARLEAVARADKFNTLIFSGMLKSFISSADKLSAEYYLFEFYPQILPLCCIISFRRK